jgi:hypothetical protein
MSKDDASSDHGGEVSERDERITARGFTGHMACMCRIAQWGSVGIKEDTISLAVSDHATGVQLCTRWFDLDGGNGVTRGEELGLVAPPQQRAVPPVGSRNRAAHVAKARLSEGAFGLTPAGFLSRSDWDVSAIDALHIIPTRLTPTRHCTRTAIPPKIHSFGLAIIEIVCLSLIGTVAGMASVSPPGRYAIMVFLGGRLSSRQTQGPHLLYEKFSSTCVERSPGRPPSLIISRSVPDRGLAARFNRASPVSAPSRRNGRAAGRG